MNRLTSRSTQLYAKSRRKSTNLELQHNTVLSCQRWGPNWAVRIKMTVDMEQAILPARPRLHWNSIRTYVRRYLHRLDIGQSVRDSMVRPHIQILS